MAILGVKTMDDAIEAMRHLPITAIPIMPLCYEHPFEFAEPVAPVKKSVRFVDEVKEEVLTSDRSENKNPKEYSPYDPEDFPEWKCKNGVRTLPICQSLPVYTKIYCHLRIFGVHRTLFWVHRTLFWMHRT